MHAHVNIWTLNDAGTSSSDSISSQIGRFLAEQPGFDSYTLIRSDEREVIAITVFETVAHLHDALQLLEQQQAFANMHHVTHGKPVHRTGEVVFHIDAHEAA